MISDVRNMDCMAYMAQFPDKFFDLAVVDPPYGIKVTKMTLGNGKNKVFRGQSNWDDAAPGDDYFKELMRVSKNQIIWGANHFISRIPKDSSCWLVWDKGTGDNDFADCELDKEYFDKMNERFEKECHGVEVYNDVTVTQQSLFEL